MPKPNQELREKLEAMYHRANTHGMNDKYDDKVWVDNILNLIELEKIEAKKEIVNMLFDGWVDVETDERWKYMTKTHKEQLLSQLEAQKKELM